MGLIHSACVESETVMYPRHSVVPQQGAGSRIVTSKKMQTEQLEQILIAEDEHLVAEELVRLVRAAGYQTVGPARDGQEAIQMAKARRPDLALVDVRMPVMDGITAAGTLYCQMSIPVVIVSAFCDKEYLAQLVDVGVFGYLVKPITEHDLRACLPVAWGRYLRHNEQKLQIQELRTTLDNRKLIERAKGILMQQMNLDEDAAMKKLNRMARDSRRRLPDMASAILETSEILEIN